MLTFHCFFSPIVQLIIQNALCTHFLQSLPEMTYLLFYTLQNTLTKLISTLSERRYLSQWYSTNL